MDSCDVLIAGAGPAGSSCAWALRAAGLDVVVLDRSTFPRDKVCGGWVTPPVMQALEIDPEAYAQAHVAQPIKGFVVACMGQRDVEVGFGRTVSYGIRRCEFDHYLLRRCGARIGEGVALNSIERCGDGWIINGEIKARLLVGAGGHFCPVSRSLGNHHSAQPVVAQEIEFEMDAAQESSCRIRMEVPELYFCRDLRGYGWCFRKGNFLNIGLGRLDPRDLPGHVNQFLQFLRKSGKVGFDVAARFAGHAYFLFGDSQRQLVDDAVLLIGDSAGLAYPFSGEGIRPAVESGILAAQVIVAADSVYTRDRLDLYSELLLARFGNGRGHLAPLADYLPRKLRDGLGRLLMRNQSFCRRVILQDWFLNMQGQPLAWQAPAGLTAESA
jgi:menaquinone-9 beta-reductase